MTRTIALPASLTAHPTTGDFPISFAETGNSVAPVQKQTSVELRDLNGDGFPDWIWRGTAYAGSWRVWYGTGSGFDSSASIEATDS